LVLHGTGDGGCLDSLGRNNSEGSDPGSIKGSRENREREEHEEIEQQFAPGPRFKCLSGSGRGRFLRRNILKHLGENEVIRDGECWLMSGGAYSKLEMVNSVSFENEIVKCILYRKTPISLRNLNFALIDDSVLSNICL